MHRGELQALLLRSLRQFPAAHAYMDQVLAQRLQTVGAKHEDYAMALMHKGMVYEAENRFEAAEPLYEQAFQIAEDTLGYDHPIAQEIEVNLKLMRSRKVKMILGQPGRSEAAEESTAQAD